MAKKSGGGGAGLLLLGGSIVLAASIPKQVWIDLTIVGAIGAVLYFLARQQQQANFEASTVEPSSALPVSSAIGSAPAAAVLATASHSQEPVAVYRGPEAQGDRVLAAHAV